MVIIYKWVLFFLFLIRLGFYERTIVFYRQEWCSPVFSKHVPWQFSLSTEIVALQIHWHDLAQYDEKLNNMPLLCSRIWGLELCRRIHKLLIF